MHDRLTDLQPYPFERQQDLLGQVTPETDQPLIRLSIGEPKHAAPDFIYEALQEHQAGIEIYPTTGGTMEVKQAIAHWLERRFALTAVDPARQVLPVNGTREALFSFAQAVFDRSDAAQRPYVMMPNPFYQIYEGAALLAGATPYLLPCTAENGYNPDFRSLTDEDWQRTQLLFLCSPGNPTGAVVPLETLQYVLAKAREHNVIIASDECYSEIYFTENDRPPGLLEACVHNGDADFSQAVVFHSLSKRSNLPGLRSGFAAGNADLIRSFLRYRTYSGGAMPLHVQKASALAWQEENHVELNRAAYREKFRKVIDRLSPVMDVEWPDAGFYLWARTPIPDEEFARELFHRENVTVLPGTYVGRSVNGQNPGAGHVRMALVATLSECLEAAERIARFCENLPARHRNS